MTDIKEALVRIVDDDAEQLKSLAFLLRMGGFEVMTYQSAQAFLEMDDPRKPGCLLLDHRRPGMTGMELQAELVERGSLLPVIFLSAHGDIPMAMQAVHRGAMDFLVKPAAPDVLIAAVEKAVKKSFETSRPTPDRRTLLKKLRRSPIANSKWRGSSLRGFSTSRSETSSAFRFPP